MKHIIHTPTADFAYVESEYDEEDIGKMGIEIVQMHREVVNLVKNEGNGLPEKEFSEIVDEYIATNKMADGADRYEQMNRDQKMIIQCLKRSFKRTRED